MIRLKTDKEIEILKEGGRRLAQVLDAVAVLIKPGVATIELEKTARKIIDDFGDKPAFLGYKPAGSKQAYPACLCVSINEEIVHGIPGDRVLEEGDIVTIDSGIVHQGLYTDMARTLPVGEISSDLKKLIEVTKQSLDEGIKQAKVGNHLGDIGFAVQSHVEKNKLTIIRDLCGHGVGYAVHEDPMVLNFGKKGQGQELKAGMVLAIEPMVAMRSDDAESVLEEDDFTYSTLNGSISAHFEHTVAILEDGPVILTK